MRRFALALVLAGCGVEIDGKPNTTSDGSTDAPTRDASIDAPPDARPCTGGDMNMSSGGQCYMLFTTNRTWAAANTACINMNARLAVLDTAQKHAAAKQFAGARDTWIGLTDQTTEGTYVWSDPAVPFAFTAWDPPNEPSNGQGVYQEDCIIIAGARAGDWDDRPCSDQVANAPAGCCSYAYMCQF
jgi:hypothetical protein